MARMIVTRATSAELMLLRNSAESHVLQGGEDVKDAFRQRLAMPKSDRRRTSF